MQRLVDYTIDNYRILDEHCKIDKVNVSTGQCVTCHIESYKPGGVPRYECENFKRVYLMRYLGSRTAQLEKPLSLLVQESMRRQSVIKGASLGGGAGTEAIALMNQLRLLDTNCTVVFDNFDFEMSWKPIYDDLLTKFSSYLGSISIKPRFHKWDFQTTLWTTSNDKPYQVVFVSWLLSEIDDKDKRSEVLREVLKSICKNGYVVVADRTELSLIQTISEFVNETSGWKTVDVNTLHEGNCGLELESIWQDFSPQANYSTAYWVLQKE